MAGIQFNVSDREMYFLDKDLPRISFPLDGMFCHLNEIMQDIDRRSLRTGNDCKQSVNSLKSFIKTNKLIDVWRIYNENRQQFTWHRKDKTQASRIDMILLGKDFLSLGHTAY